MIHQDLMNQDLRQEMMMRPDMPMRRQDVDMRRPEMRPDLLDDGEINVITRERAPSLTCDKGCQTVSKNRSRRTKSTSDKQDTVADKPESAVKKFYYRAATGGIGKGIVKSMN